MTAVLKGISLGFLGVLISFAVTAESANAKKDEMEKSGEKQCMIQRGCYNMPKDQGKACKKLCKKMIGRGGQVNPNAGGGYGQQPMYNRPY